MVQPRHYTEELDRNHYPDGDFNVGLAHGISGPLALLAIAHDRGYRAEGMEPAMRRIVDWLLCGRFADEHGPLWPHRIGIADQLAGRVEPGPTRAAWCYGTAGVAHALNLAGRALDHAEAMSVAGSALEGVFKRPWRRANLNDTALCHGMAGLLQIVRHSTNADGLVQKIVEGGTPAGKAGLLEGAAGVGLALASYAGICAEWDSVLLLS
ncbi:lanthionine synthetase LanC family protein [Kutzneria chonburiensis]|uniref:lanthionine synthetase LanC family protein n=1 Tax=Kutzneria chonburiensis TaxID=1483604 RepID=UPI002362DC44|nr:lanthionine synthetase LanC family protein [Kutzneria chonburiensis]